MNIYDIKPGDKVKLKTKSSKNIRTKKALNFWQTCGGKTFKVVLVDYDNKKIYLDFRDIFTPIGNGTINISSIKRIIPSVRLQDDLFKL